MQIAGSFINGNWVNYKRQTIDVYDPSTGQSLHQLPVVTEQDIDRALEAADNGFIIWSQTPAWDRYKVMRKAATYLRDRIEEVAISIVMEQGKPLAEARIEAANAADIIDWYAEECRRSCGRSIPARSNNVRQRVITVPVGPVAAFSPWNFPLGQSVRKVAAALAAGCSVIIKPPEECPSCNIKLAQAFEYAELPAGVLNMVFGDPEMISTRLINSPVIKKMTFTGSIPVGKALGEMAARHVKRTTLELGGHAPFIVLDDVDVEHVARLGATLKFRNAGQVCVSPTRFYIHRDVYEKFVKVFTEAARQIVIGSGLSPDTTMGPMANIRRVESCTRFVNDAVEKGAVCLTGGKPIAGNGYFFPPTVLTDVPSDARILHEEPFGPIAPLIPFDDPDEVLALANELPFGLAAFLFTRNGYLADKLIMGLESGMVSVNHFGLALPETPFGGIKESGYGSEGGTEGLDAYLVPKFVSELLIP